MSEIKDREECYLIGCRLEHHHGVQNSQDLNVDSETWSEKSLSFSKVSKKKFMHSMPFNFLISWKAEGDINIVLIL